MSEPGEQTVTHIFPNMSRGKANQAMKFGLLIGYNKKNIFLVEKSCRNVSPDPSLFFFFF